MGPAHCYGFEGCHRKVVLWLYAAMIDFRMRCQQKSRQVYLNITIYVCNRLFWPPKKRKRPKFGKKLCDLTYFLTLGLSTPPPRKMQLISLLRHMHYTADLAAETRAILDNLITLCNKCHIIYDKKKKNSKVVKSKLFKDLDFLFNVEQKRLL